MLTDLINLDIKWNGPDVFAGLLLYVQYIYMYILDSVSLSICASTDAEESDGCTCTCGVDINTVEAL